MASKLPTMTFAQATGLLPGRQRSGSFNKRPRSDSGEKSCPGEPPKDPGTYTDRAFEHWQLVTNVISTADSSLKVGDPFFALFNSLKQVLNSSSALHFDMAKELDSLKQKDASHEEVLAKNRAGGNLVNSVEKSAAYDKACEELKNSGNLIKVLNLDFGEELKSSSEITKKAREILNNISSIKNDLDSAQIISLGKETKVHSNKNTVPILIKSKTRDTRDRIEKAVKSEGYSSPFHWPKIMVGQISKIREQVKVYKDEKIDLNNRLIMIRPSLETGKRINIYYGEEIDGKKKWTLLDSVKTPVNDALLKQFKGEQICKSNFFTL